MMVLPASNCNVGLNVLPVELKRSALVPDAVMVMGILAFGEVVVELELLVALVVVVDDEDDEAVLLLEVATLT